MRPPYYFPPQGMMNQMPAAPVAPRFPMYAPYMMRTPMMNQMPMQMPPQIPMDAAGAAAAAGAAGVAAGAPRLEGFLAGANSLFSNAQKFTPYIQQAAPMFKNLPALWRMYRGFKDSPDPLESSTVAMPTERPRGDTTPGERSQRERSGRGRGSRQNPEPVQPIATKPSRPMIFQPPFD
ncbi:VrrA/YqfQ family protein [Solibacillus merdavium]|uniref:YqfQ-like protein n=2 Tax=Solibacillus TaxID=648800 RepID=A0ABR8XIY0_9BACL|nr:VrrA/YqfQ family protein [Solibacillus merdavium]MBD8031890.1 hypothetical protein [Solibacillus merdavium]